MELPEQLMLQLLHFRKLLSERPLSLPLLFAAFAIVTAKRPPSMIIFSLFFKLPIMLIGPFAMCVSIVRWSKWLAGQKSLLENGGRECILRMVKGLGKSAFSTWLTLETIFIFYFAYKKRELSATRMKGGFPAWGSNLFFTNKMEGKKRLEELSKFLSSIDKIGEAHIQMAKERSNPKSMNIQHHVKNLLIPRGGPARQMSLDDGPTAQQIEEISGSLGWGQASQNDSSVSGSLSDLKKDTRSISAPASGNAEQNPYAEKDSFMKNAAKESIHSNNGRRMSPSPNQPSSIGSHLTSEDGLDSVDTDTASNNNINDDTEHGSRNNSFMLPIHNNDSLARITQPSPVLMSSGGLQPRSSISKMVRSASQTLGKKLGSAVNFKSAYLSLDSGGHEEEIEMIDDTQLPEGRSSSKVPGMKKVATLEAFFRSWEKDSRFFGEDYALRDIRRHEFSGWFSRSFDGGFGNFYEYRHKSTRFKARNNPSLIANDNEVDYDVITRHDVEHWVCFYWFECRMPFQITDPNEKKEVRRMIKMIEEWVELKFPVDAEQDRLCDECFSCDTLFFDTTRMELPALHRPLIYYVGTGILAPLAAKHIFAALYGYTERHSGSMKYLYRSATRKNGKTKTPIIFIHGLGVGPFMYATMVDAITRRFGRDHDISFPHIPHISQKPVESIPSPQEVVSQLEGIVAYTGHKSAHFIGHSFGCAMCAWTIKTAPHIIKALTLLDPICFYVMNLAAQQVMNETFRHTKVQNLVDAAIGVFAFRELYTTYQLCYINANPRFLEIRAEDCPPGKTFIFIAENDSVVPTRTIERQFRDVSHVRLHVSRGAQHGDFFLPWNTVDRKLIMDAIWDIENDHGGNNHRRGGSSVGGSSSS